MEANKSMLRTTVSLPRQLKVTEIKTTAKATTKTSLEAKLERLYAIGPLNTNTRAMTPKDFGLMLRDTYSPSGGSFGMTHCATYVRSSSFFA